LINDAETKEIAKKANISVPHQQKTIAQKDHQVAGHFSGLDKEELGGEEVGG